MEGRMRRRTYWLSVFGILFIAAVLNMGVVKTGDVVAIRIFLLLVNVCIVAISVPRLHDAGYSGWYALLAVIPFGALIPIIMCMMPSEKKDNKWGKYERS
ncbi:DUF805 domain-containing protein [Ornithobacterium rhinotracheale]|uniref:DUF805 domain-containing protein n=1 Tax=Ornithobacterium rhinotracheale TaxID=28251 RepID=UPI00129C9D89|nr:DUF805 domain-containing protein [Ornithobacterium rhinotracheale]MRJ10273.1 DUF805 domain-containing protein [Ornithobacterium rhinotracheale]